jgi:hypothetical protein
VVGRRLRVGNTTEMLRKILKIAVIALVAGFIILQFIRPDFTNPPLIAGDTLTASAQVPADVQQILTRSCNDCHSNQTVYPWYSKVTPFNWFLADHIADGRRQLNFSVWNTYSTDKKIKKLDEICEQVEHSYMPLPSYLWIHRDAVLEESQAKALCEWANTESARLSSAEN